VDLKDEEGLAMGFETQNVEWKSSWRDEYLKWVCGFANAQGGVLEIGKDDNGTVVGVENARGLLTDIPSKITNAMAIVVDVDLRAEDGKQYLTITVQPHPYPISYHGKYYLRSGASNRELTGNALDEFLLRKEGKTWDGVPVPYVGVPDLDYNTLKEFRRKAISSQRLTPDDLEMTDAELIDSLRLAEGNYLKRAAILLFHPEPDRWFTGASVKIGYFQTGADLLFMDELTGPILTMPDRVLDLIFTKYFRGLISYRGIQRVETFPVAKDALREALVNAIVHRDYSTGVPIQIKVFPDEIIIFNDGGLPDGWTVEELRSRHQSLPHNPEIARAFFRSGQIEAWGRGIEKIETASRKAYKPDPVFGAKPTGISVALPYPAEFIESSTTPDADGVTESEDVRQDDQDVRQDVRQDVERLVEQATSLGSRVYAVLSAVSVASRSRAEILNEIGLNDEYRSYERHIRPLVDAGFVARTVPEKPKAHTQRYVLSDSGRAVLRKLAEQKDAAHG
jgi:ATP-dependent DNA helicase RecG